MIPVITIDGPSGVGKGTVSSRVAQTLGWHFLDSGALYRAVALAVVEARIPLDAAIEVAAKASALDVRFADGGRVFQGDDDISAQIRAETVGEAASRIAALPAVRAALLAKQRALRQAPGLVADGRDMGTTIFPDAELKVFLTAAAEVRAERRYKQLKQKGVDANLPRLLGEIRERDRRDSERPVSPLKPAPDACLLDTSTLSIDEVVDQVIRWWRAGGC